MRFAGTLLVALILSSPSAPAHAAEKGALIRAGELKTKPFADAPAAARFTANQQVNVISRQGGWVQVEADGKTGWLRMLNLRMASAGAPSRKGNNSAMASLLRTGSSGKTVTTGVKGMDEEDIRNATIDIVELQELHGLAVPPLEATAHAQQSGLKEYKVEYLKEGGK